MTRKALTPVATLALLALAPGCSNEASEATLDAALPQLFQIDEFELRIEDPATDPGPGPAAVERAARQLRSSCTDASSSPADALWRVTVFRDTTRNDRPDPSEHAWTVTFAPDGTPASVEPAATTASPTESSSAPIAFLADLTHPNLDGRVEAFSLHPFTPQ